MCIIFIDLLSIIAGWVIVGSVYGQFPVFADADEQQNLIMHRFMEGQGLTVCVGVIVCTFVRCVYVAKDGEKWVTASVNPPSRPLAGRLSLGRRFISNSIYKKKGKAMAVNSKPFFSPPKKNKDVLNKIFCNIYDALEQQV